MKRRVVVTGMDLVSSIGIGLHDFWQSAQNGHCGIRHISSYDPTPYSTQIGGEILDFSLDSLPQLNKPKRYTKAAQYALYCAHHAILQSGLDASTIEKAGTFIGTSLGGSPELESAYQAFYQDSWKKIPALSVLKGMPNAITNHLAIAFDIKGPNTTFSNACVSSAEAIGHAYQQIKSGLVSTVICGGTESLLWETSMAAWCKLRVMSTQNEMPSKACQPFDKNRSGMVMADGAGVLVLEDYEQAKARGAAILGEIIGFGSSCDASHITAPSTEGQTRAIFAALEDARTSPSDIQYISAHGTGTQLNDMTETQTIKSVFGEQAYDIPITAQKAMTGHAIGGAGALEIIATFLCMQNDTLLPTINLDTPDPMCDLDYVANDARYKAVDIAMSNHFAFGGSNAVLVLQKAIA